MTNKEYNELKYKYDRFIRVTAIRLDIDNSMFQELYQVGLIALYEAESKYKEEQGTFHTFIMRYITYEMMDYLTNFSRTVRIPSNRLIEAKKDDSIQLKTSISINTPINEDYTIEDTLGYEEIDDSLDDNQKLIRSRLREEMDKLKPQYQQIIWMYDVLSMTFQEIGDELKLTRENVRQQYVKAIKIIREKLT